MVLALGSWCVGVDVYVCRTLLLLWYIYIMCFTVIVVIC